MSMNARYIIIIGVLLIAVSSKKGKNPCKRTARQYDKCLSKGYESSYGCEVKKRANEKKCQKIEKELFETCKDSGFEYRCFKDADYSSCFLEEHDMPWWERKHLIEDANEETCGQACLDDQACTGVQLYLNGTCFKTEVNPPKIKEQYVIYTSALKSCFEVKEPEACALRGTTINATFSKRISADIGECISACKEDPTCTAMVAWGKSYCMLYSGPATVNYRITKAAFRTCLLEQ